MGATIAWSYDLLPPSEQRFVRQISVFVGGFTLGAAEAVMGHEPDQTIDALDLVTALVEKSLLRPTNAPDDDDPRYLMLETIREFAEERLGASGEAEAVRARHAAWCLEFADRLATTIPPIVQPRTMARLEAEHANLRVALDWFLETGWIDELTRLAVGWDGFGTSAGMLPKDWPGSSGSLPSSPAGHRERRIERR